MQELVELAKSTGDGVKIVATSTDSILTIHETELSTINSNLTSIETIESSIDASADTLAADKCVVATSSLTRPNNTTAYAINDVVGTDPATNLSFVTGSTSVLIAQATLKIKVNAVPAGMTGFKLHLYKDAPTAIADNVAFNIIAADIDNYIGYITFSTPSDFGDNLFSQSASLSMPVVPASTTLYGVLTTDTAYTPSAQTVYSLSVRSVKCV